MLRERKPKEPKKEYREFQDDEDVIRAFLVGKKAIGKTLVSMPAKSYGFGLYKHIGGNTSGTLSHIAYMGKANNRVFVFLNLDYPDFKMLERLCVSVPFQNVYILEHGVIPRDQLQEFHTQRHKQKSLGELDV